jgi:hypothetical protein
MTYQTSRISAAGVQPSEREEGYLTKMIERQTTKIPSDAFLWAAGASIVGALALKAASDHRNAQFVGQWAPTFLLLGLYNKLVKLQGSE